MYSPKIKQKSQLDVYYFWITSN